MMDITPAHYMILSAALFTIGVIGVLVRRNIIIIFMSIELILNAVNINLVANARQLENLVGQVFVVFVIAVAAAEAAVGLGIRNFIDLPTALREMVRVVRSGGRVVSLEIVRMEGRGLMPKLLPLHFRYVTPWLGSLIARDREAYTYLPKSLENFLSATELDQAMRDSGLQNIRHKKLGLGTVAIHIGEKP